MRKTLLLTAFLAGCVEAPEPCQDGTCTPGTSPDGALDRAEMVRSFYGTVRKNPTVVWWAKGDCPDGRLLVPDGPGVCAQGVTFLLVDRTHIGLAFDWRANLAHELLHVHLAEVNDGDGDRLHQRPEWQTLLPQAVNIMKGE